MHHLNSLLPERAPAPSRLPLTNWITPFLSPCRHVSLAALDSPAEWSWALHHRHQQRLVPPGCLLRPPEWARDSRNWRLWSTLRWQRCMSALLLPSSWPPLSLPQVLPLQALTFALDLVLSPSTSHEWRRANCRGICPQSNMISRLSAATSSELFATDLRWPSAAPRVSHCAMLSSESGAAAPKLAQPQSAAEASPIYLGPRSGQPNDRLLMIGRIMIPFSPLSSGAGVADCATCAN